MCIGMKKNWFWFEFLGKIHQIINHSKWRLLYLSAMLESLIQFRLNVCKMLSRLACTLKSCLKIFGNKATTVEGVNGKQEISTQLLRRRHSSLLLFKHFSLNFCFVRLKFLPSCFVCWWEISTLRTFSCSHCGKTRK